ncbi:hypothetical protein ELY33_12720 [Vreelandella andesensis]|uniref:Uncharacterized protein n=1 Tax=Vreelandella andesensis TaxID=447567 RepID=A0A3S0YTZ5_9GAMM|nr:hypothetical protein [Halomonas andesensis]RUR29476.1 hypothetical protein ELY33_12720 [Halomonas andesensis]
MDVSVNTQEQIVKSFSAWMPMVLVALILYGALFAGLTIWGLMQFFGMEQAVAQTVGLPSGVLLLGGLFYIYVKWLTRSLASYQLSLSDKQLIVKGISGRRTIEHELPVGNVKKIHIGTHMHTMQKPTYGQGGAKSKAASRLTFVLSNGDYFKLDFAMNAFDNESLYDFLAAMKRKGVDINLHG